MDLLIPTDSINELPSNLSKQIIVIFNWLAQELASIQIIAELAKQFSFAIFSQNLNYDLFIVINEFKEMYFTKFLKKSLPETTNSS